MVAVWVLTLPAAGLMGALGHEGVQVFPSDTSGVIAVGLVALVIAGSLFWLTRRTDHVNSENVVGSATPTIAATIGAPA
jgi:hypothetical protein